MNGAEMMLNSLGLKPAIDAIKVMAENGTFAKIVAFADQVELMNAQLANLIERMGKLEKAIGETGEFDDAEFEPGSASVRSGNVVRVAGYDGGNVIEG